MQWASAVHWIIIPPPESRNPSPYGYSLWKREKNRLGVTFSSFSEGGGGKPEDYKWFTLVELMIVITIVGIVGVASIGSFSHLGELQDNRAIQSSISNALSDIESSLHDNKIASYEIHMDSGSLGYFARTDFYGKSVQIALQSFDFASGAGIVTTNSTSTGMLYTWLWSADWLEGTTLRSASGAIVPFAFSGGADGTRFEVTSMIDATHLNAFVFQYYDRENLTGPDEKQVRLVSISSAATHYDALIISNILGKKTLIASGASLDSLDTATLTFEKNGKEVILTVQK